jgi:hypothetical protein
VIEEVQKSSNICNKYYFFYDCESEDTYPVFLIVDKSFYDYHKYVPDTVLDKEIRDFLKTYSFYECMDSAVGYNGIKIDAEKKLIELGLEKIDD